jgi:hypothetical protein
LHYKDEELSSRIYSLREIYKPDRSKKIPGLPKLISIINEEVEGMIIEKRKANSVIEQLKEE